MYVYYVEITYEKSLIPGMRLCLLLKAENDDSPFMFSMVFEVHPGCRILEKQIIKSRTDEAKKSAAEANKLAAEASKQAMREANEVLLNKVESGEATSIEEEELKLKINLMRFMFETLIMNDA